MMDVSFHEIAVLEMNDAAEYYESKASSLGKSFIVEVEWCMKRIKENPYSAPVILKNVRNKILLRFPYSIMYSVVGDSSIRILAIANQKRRPFYWRLRR